MALRAIVSSNNLRAIVDTDSLEPVTVFSDIKALTEFINLEYGIDFLNLEAVNILLDADSKNLFFTPEFRADQVQNVTITESLAKAITTDVTDSIDEIGFIDLPSLGTARPASDTFSVTESIVTLLIFERVFSDTASVAESSVLNFGKNPSDSANVAESYASSFGKPASDTSSISESSDVVRNKTFGTPYYNTNAYTTSNIATVNYTVTVAPKSSGSGNAFYINGMERLNFNWELHDAPSRGNKYLVHKFDVSDSSLSGHPFKFSAYDDGSHNSYFNGGATHYPIDENVEEGYYASGTQGQSGAYIEWTVALEHYTYGANPIYYYCANHSGMGGRIDVQDDMHVLLRDNQFSKQVSFARTFTDTTSLDDTASASDDLATESGINKNNVVSVAESLGPFAVSKPLTDTVTISEQINVNGENQFIDSPTISDSPSIGFTLATVANSVSVSENINVQLFEGGTALVNKSPLNTYSLNS